MYGMPQYPHQQQPQPVVIPQPPPVAPILHVPNKAKEKANKSKGKDEKSKQHMKKAPIKTLKKTKGKSNRIYTKKIPLIPPKGTVVHSPHKGEDASMQLARELIPSPFTEDSESEDESSDVKECILEEGNEMLDADFADFANDEGVEGVEVSGLDGNDANGDVETNNGVVEFHQDSQEVAPKAGEIVSDSANEAMEEEAAKLEDGVEAETAVEESNADIETESKAKKANAVTPMAAELNDKSRASVELLSSNSVANGGEDPSNGSSMNVSDDDAAKVGDNQASSNDEDASSTIAPAKEDEEDPTEGVDKGANETIPHEDSTNDAPNQVMAASFVVQPGVYPVPAAPLPAAFSMVNAPSTVQVSIFMHLSTHTI
jgi:hypothetical protein